MKQKTFDMFDGIFFWIVIFIDALCVVASAISSNIPATFTWLLVIMLQFRIRHIEKQLREKSVEVLVLVEKVPGNER